jgi:hypothetical protein
MVETLEIPEDHELLLKAQFIHGFRKETGYR